MRCKHCGKPVVRTNWYDGPGWNHADGGPACQTFRAEPHMPACAACDKPVEILPSGVMIHPDGTGHEQRRSAVEWPRLIPSWVFTVPTEDPAEPRYMETLDLDERGGH